jgi:hypothetical protein
LSPPFLFCALSAKRRRKNILLMKLARLMAFGAIAGLIMLCPVDLSAGEPSKKHTLTKKRVRETRQAPSSQEKVLLTRQKLIQRRKASRDRLKNLLPVYEQTLERQSADYETKREYYEKNLISSLELQQSERAVMHTRTELERVRQLIAEDDRALSLTEEVAREALERVPSLPSGAYDETTTLIRYNGSANWSLADAVKVRKYFQARFGYPLPVSAWGQSETHERMGFDHRNALDVGLRPDSAEGRELMAFLRAAGIPFLAFRNAVRGMATGAHIHIGRPSLRLARAKPSDTDSGPADRDADQS